MTKLQKSLGLMLLAATAGPASAQIVPPDVATQQYQAQSIIQQQNLGTQLNSLQLQQNILRDQIREQQLFAPQPYYGPNSGYQAPGASVPGAAFQPQPPGVALLPNRSRPAAPEAPPPAPTPRPETK